MEHRPDLTLIPWQGLSLEKELFIAASMMAGEMGNAGGWGFSVTYLAYQNKKTLSKPKNGPPQAIPLG